MTGDSSGDPARSGDPSDAPSEALVRRLGTTDAVMIGLGSMIGAGVFAAFGPAAKAAGTGLLIGLVLAAMIAYCNAVASANLPSRTSRVASMTSFPTPSPGIHAILYFAIRGGV